MTTSVYVLEGAWDRALEAPQVLPYMMAYGQSHREVKIHHRTFRSAEDIQYYVSRIPKGSRAFLYIACHGEPGLLNPSDGRRKIPMADVLSALSAAKEDAVGFVHFGSCQFVLNTSRKKTLNELRRAAKASWASGYVEVIGWLPSMLLDLALISEVFVPWHKAPAARKTAERNAELFVLGYEQLARTLGFSALSSITGTETLFPKRLK